MRLPKDLAGLAPNRREPPALPERRRNAPFVLVDQVLVEAPVADAPAELRPKALLCLVPPVRPEARVVLGRFLAAICEGLPRELSADSAMQATLAVEVDACDSVGLSRFVIRKKNKPERSFVK